MNSIRLCDIDLFIFSHSLKFHIYRHACHLLLIILYSVKATWLILSIILQTITWEKWIPSLLFLVIIRTVPHNNYGETLSEVIVVRATCPKLVVKFPLRPALLWSGQARLRNLLFIKPTKRLLFLWQFRHSIQNLGVRYKNSKLRNSKEAH